jgi:hypothetical protein
MIFGHLKIIIINQAIKAPQSLGVASFLPEAPADSPVTDADFP